MPNMLKTWWTPPITSALVFPVCGLGGGGTLGGPGGGEGGIVGGGGDAAGHAGNARHKATAVRTPGDCEAPSCCEARSFPHKMASSHVPLRNGKLPSKNGQHSFPASFGCAKDCGSDSKREC